MATKSFQTLPRPKPKPPIRVARLNDKQEAFAQAFIRTWNIKHSAMEAGVSEKSASSMGCQWMDETRYPLVVKRVAELIEQQKREHKITPERAIKEMAALAFFNPKWTIDANGNQLELKDMPDEVAACIQSYEVKSEYVEDPNDPGNFKEVKRYIYKFWDKVKALEMMCKHLRLFQDINVQQTNNTLNVVGADFWNSLLNVGKPIQDDVELEIEDRLKGAIPVNVQPTQIAGPAEAAS